VLALAARLVDDDELAVAVHHHHRAVLLGLDDGAAEADGALGAGLEVAFASILPRAAAPPMWKVRIVSCVPGSPIDWAAMMPTASPMLTR
jgi:hypothetical protein